MDRDRVRKLWVLNIVAVISLVAGLTLMVGPASAQVADVACKAGAVVGSFAANIEADVGGQLSPFPVRSVALFEESMPGAIVTCVTISQPTTVATFTLPYDPLNPNPRVAARAYDDTGCVMVNAPAPSDDSLNACLVTYVVAPPVFLDSSPPSP